LGKHFSKYFNNNEETVSINLMEEWYEFKFVGKHLKIQDLLERRMSNGDRFPFLSKLLEIVVV
jgi:hypothetical protein